MTRWCLDYSVLGVTFGNGMKQQRLEDAAVTACHRLRMTIIESLGTALVTSTSSLLTSTTTIPFEMDSGNATQRNSDTWPEYEFFRLHWYCYDFKSIANYLRKQKHVSQITKFRTLNLGSFRRSLAASTVF
jgi:hypothetical protein